MSSCDESNIKKNYIVQSAADFDILSACTAFYTNNIYNCTGGTLTLHSDIVSANTINASVYLSGGTNLLDILVSLDNFTTGATLIGDTAYFDRTNSLSAYTLDLSSLDVSDTYITAFTYDNANTFTISDNSGSTFNATINTVTGLTVNGGLSATTVSACTGIYTSNLYGCSPITVHDNIQSITSSATGTTSFAFGEDNNAHGDYSFAINRLNTASGLASFASGRGAIASGSYSHSIGVSTNATAIASYAEGSNTVASGSSAHAEGEETIAGGDNSHAEGKLTTASGDNSHAEGEGTTASGTYSHSEGYYNLASGNASHAEGGNDGSPMSNPTSATTHSAHAEGIGTLSSGMASHAEGNLTTASGSYSHAGGSNSIASGITSFIHSTSSLVTGDRSVVLGGQNITGTTNDTVYVPNLNIGTAPIDNSLSQIIARGSDGTIKYRDVDSIISAATSADTYVTGFTYDDINTFTISDNSGSTFNASINVLSATTISATTYFGDGSNLTGIPHTTDTFVSGGTYNDITDIITFTNTTGGTFNVTGITDTFVTGVTLNIGNYELTTSRNDTADIVTDLSILASDVKVTGGTYDINTGIVTFTNNSGGTFNVTGFTSGMTDTFVTGGTLNSGTLTLDRQNGSVSISGFVSTFTGNTSGDCITDLYITNLYGCSPITVHDNFQHISSSATGVNSIAWGSGTTASGDYSHAEGLGNIASGKGSHAEGGVIKTNASLPTSATAFSSHAEGYGTLASGNASHAEGGSTTASGNYSHSEGSNTTAGPGAGSHAEGLYTIASGTQSHAEGYETDASGDSSHAEGYGSTASGYGSHAEGQSTASGTYSHAEGYGSTASGGASHAEGKTTLASGYISHAEGFRTTASGVYSHSGGKGLDGGSNKIIASGDTSFIHFKQTTTSGIIGAYGDYSAILGGNDHNIGTGSTSSGIFGGSVTTIGDDVLRSVVLGGSGITGTTNDTVYVPKLNINLINNDNSLTQILSRDSSDGTIKYRDVSSIIGAASADTYVTGFTYDDINTFTITRNDGTAFTQTINVLSATTISGGTLYGDGSNLTGIGGTFTGNTSASCITDLWVTNISGCSPVTIGTEAIFNQDVSGTTSIWTTPNPGGGSVNLMTPALTIRQQGSSQNYSGPAIRFNNTNANENAYIFYQDGGSGADNGNAFNFISDGGFNFEASGDIGSDGFFKIAKGSSTFIIDDNGSAPRTDVRINNGNGGTAYSRLGLGATGDYWYFEADDVSTPMHIGWDDGVIEKNVFTFTTDSGIIDTPLFITSGVTTNQDLLTVSGRTRTINFQMMSGATDGYILTSDAVGNSSWQPSIDGNTFVTGFTYDDINTFTISDNSGSTFNASINVLSATTISGGTLYGDGSNLTGISTENTTITAYTYDNANTFTISDSSGSTFDASIDIMTGLTINGESTGTTLTVNGQSVFSGESTDVVQIYGSGSTSPIFRVQGSSGELFSVTDSLVGELFAVNDISGIPILQVHSDNRIILGDNVAPSLYTTAKVTATSGSSTSIYSVPVSAYTGAWFEYTAKGTTSLRAGNIASIFSGASVNHNETTTTDIGDTSDLLLDVIISGTNATLTASATTSNWEIKTIIRSI